jgi:hypothetical protein
VQTYVLQSEFDIETISVETDILFLLVVNILFRFLQLSMITFCSTIIMAIVCIVWLLFGVKSLTGNVISIKMVKCSFVSIKI